LHPVACTRSGSGFPSNATLFWIFYSIITATCFGRMTIFRPKKYSGYYWIKYSKQCCVRRKPRTWPVSIMLSKWKFVLICNLYTYMTQVTFISVSLFYHGNNIRWRVSVVKFLITLIRVLSRKIFSPAKAMAVATLIGDHNLGLSRQKP
jgi:hypothetical protein